MFLPIQAHSTYEAAPRPPFALPSVLALFGLLATTACSGDSPSTPAEPETPTPVLTSVSPNTLVEGASVTLQGSDFGTTPSANVVRVDGVTATVTAATTTQLRVTVPVFECRPHRTVEVQVSRSGKASNSLTAQVMPAAFIDVALGEMLLIKNPSDFCLQFASAAAQTSEYLVGIGSAAERPDVLFDVSLTGETGLAALAPVLLANTTTTVISQVRTDEHPAPIPTTTSLTAPRSNFGGWGLHARVQQRMNRLAREAIDRARRQPTGLSGALAGRGSLEGAATPAVGDRIEVRVPTFSGTTFEAVCTPIRITTEIRVVGERAIFATDVQNPSTDALTDAEIQAFSNAFDSFIYDADTESFGTPFDRDGNGRTLMVLTVEVNEAFDLGEGAGGVVFPAEHLDPSACPASNVGEIAYLSVPDPDSGTGKSGYLETFLPMLAHEFVHVVQVSVRWGDDGVPDGNLLTNWEAEGQATLGMEIVGHAAQGLNSGQDYDATTAWSEQGHFWYRPGLENLAGYYGYDDGARRADAPESCSLFLASAASGTRASAGCDAGSAYGASWSFFRYLTDRYGPNWPGGEAGFMRDWIIRNPGLQGIANVEALLGRPFEEFFAEWAAMHYLDAHVPDAASEFLMSSWDLGDVLPGLDANATLEPRERSFAPFVASLSVRGGSTAYSLFRNEMARPATALRIRNADDDVLSGDMQPVLWVVRTR